MADREVVIAAAANVAPASEVIALGLVYVGDQIARLADAAEPVDAEVLPEYPYPDGDTIVLGPEAFASADGALICWRGGNYYRGGSPSRDMWTEQWLATYGSAMRAWLEGSPEDLLGHPLLASAVESYSDRAELSEALRADIVALVRRHLDQLEVRNGGAGE